MGARPQEAVRGECGDNNYTRVVLQTYNRMTSIKIPCGPDIFPLLLFLPFLMSLSSSALIRSPLRSDHRSSVHSRPIRMMLDPEDKDDLDNREYEDFPQEPTYLQASYMIPAYSEGEETRDTGIMKAPSKRYLGIEIPDYVASPNKGNLLKAIQNRMVAAGK